MKVVVGLKKQVQISRRLSARRGKRRLTRFLSSHNLLHHQHPNAILDVAVSLDWPFLLLWINVLDGIMQEPVPSPLCP